MKCNLSTINGWCGISNKPCKECITPICKLIKKAYRQGRVEAKYFTSYIDDVEQRERRYNEALSLAIKALEQAVEALDRPPVIPTEKIGECGYCPTKRDGILTIVSKGGDTE